MTNNIEMMLLKKISVEALRTLANNEEVQYTIQSYTQKLDDFIQVKMGKVSHRSLEEAIEMAITVSAIRDDKTLQKIISLVTTLYATTEINRGAIVGGTLLKELGSNIFPHIDKKELRFAKPINKKLLNSISITVKELFISYKAKYNLKEFADYSNYSVINSSASPISAPTVIILSMINKIFR